MNAVPPPTGWIPLLVGEDQGIQVDWAYMGEARFTEAFFWDTAKDLAARPFNNQRARRSAARGANQFRPASGPPQGCSWTGLPCPLGECAPGAIVE